MDVYQIGLLALLALFYTAYFTKMFLQRRKGITTNQMGKGDKEPSVRRVENVLRVATLLIVPVEIGSIVLNTRSKTNPLSLLGMIFAGVGIAIFIIAMLTMRDSWRAGIPDHEETTLIRHGIYRVSRNPAFLGFDLLYIGCLVTFPNVPHVATCIFAVVMLHLQILQEEKYLAVVFSDEYQQYRKQTGRYFMIL